MNTATLESRYQFANERPRELVLPLCHCDTIDCGTYNTISYARGSDVVSVLKDARRLFKTPKSWPFFISLSSSPRIFYTQIEDGLFWKASACSKALPFIAPIKLPVFSFLSWSKKKSSFYSTIFIIWRKASGKQFVRIRNLYEALVSLRTSSASIKPTSIMRLNVLVLFLY